MSHLLTTYFHHFPMVRMKGTLVLLMVSHLSGVLFSCTEWEGEIKKTGKKNYNPFGLKKHFKICQCLFWWAGDQFPGNRSRTNSTHSKVLWRACSRCKKGVVRQGQRKKKNATDSASQKSRVQKQEKTQMSILGVKWEIVIFSKYK